MHGHSECENPYPFHDVLWILNVLTFENSVDKGLCDPRDPHEETTTNHNLSPHPHKNVWL